MTRIGIVVVVMVLLSACGSTVTPGSGDALPGTRALGSEHGADEDLILGSSGPSRGFDGPLAPDTMLSESPRATRGASSPSALSRGGQSGQTQPGATPDAAVPADRRPVAAGTPGVTDDEITIGLSFSDDAGEANAAAGGEGITQGDPRRNHETLIRWFNERGGFAGREITPVYHRFSAMSATPRSAQLQEACTTYTQDHQVFAVFIDNVEDTFLECMHRHPIGLIGSPGFTNADARTFEQYPRWLEVNSYSLSAAAALTPQGQDELGFFDPDELAGQARVGLITYDHPRFRRALEQHLVPSLARAGHEPVEIRYAKYVERLADASETSADISSAVLRFRAAGVSHVMLLEYDAFLTVLFMIQAENQGYRPSYGLNSQNGGQLITDFVPEAQLEKASVVGWSPGDDVLRERDADWPARQVCKQIFEEEGIVFEDPNAEGVAYLHCDSFFFAKAAIDATSGPLSANVFVEGSLALGDRFQSPSIGPTQFAASKRYGVARYNLARYFNECSCFRYVSDWRKVP